MRRASGASWHLHNAPPPRDSCQAALKTSIQNTRPDGFAMVAPSEESKEASYSDEDNNPSSLLASSKPKQQEVCIYEEGRAGEPDLDPTVTECCFDDANQPPCVKAGRCVSSCATYGRVCPHVAQIAARNACQTIQKLSVDSRVFPQQQKPTFYKIEPNDVSMGQRLGHGGFSNVNQCVLTAGRYAGRECAVKYLRKQVMVDLQAFRHGSADLAGESYFLHVLDHKNIIKLLGISSRPLETSFASGMECGFFIVMERLYDTLDKRIDRWKEEREKHGAGLLSRWSHDHKVKKKAELMDRVRIAHMIADALEYLHSKNIVYRDLKPDNVGFDRDGVLKLFDFGLAKELKDKDKRESEMYDLTGNTGSRRYMAPEVALEEHYNMSVDAYSFGILLWEICAAETPFHGYSSGKHMELVVMGGERPSMDSGHTACWPMNLQWLMNRCWSASPADRPTFTAIKKVLLEVLECKESAIAPLPAGSRSSSNEVDAARSELPSLKPLSPAKGRSKTWGFMKRS